MPKATLPALGVRSNFPRSSAFIPLAYDQVQIWCPPCRVHFGFNRCLWASRLSKPPSPMVVMSAVRVAQTIITLDSFASMVVMVMMMMMLTIITPTSERVSERVASVGILCHRAHIHTHSYTGLTRLPITYHSCVLRWHTPPSQPVPGLCMLAEVPLRMVIYVILFFSLLPFCVTGVCTPYHKRHQITMFSPLPGGIQAQAHGLLYVILQFINTLLNWTERLASLRASFFLFATCHK